MELIRESNHCIYIENQFCECLILWGDLWEVITDMIYFSVCLSNFGYLIQLSCVSSPPAGRTDW